MTDQAPNQGATGSGPSGTAAVAEETPAAVQSPLSVGSQGDAFDERPELFVAGAFVGGLVIAQVLRRVGSS